MIFVDTSAIYAWTDAADPNHRLAVKRLQAILDRQEELLTHNYVLVESVALVHARLGLAAATALARDSAAFVVEWVDEIFHTAGIRELERSTKSRVSFVDQISFLVMKRRQVATAFAFDANFSAAGFAIFE